MSRAEVAHQVVIYGGGMAGALLAKALSREFQVTLVDPNEYFEVPMSVPRSLVKPDFADGAIVRFADALPGVVHLRAALIELRPEGGLVRLADGREQLLRAEITVLATGSAFSNPLMRAIEGASVSERKDFYARYQQRIASAKRILIVGGGPIGVEVAGEVIENFPGKTVTILESGSRVLSGTSSLAAAHAAKVLTQGGVTILTGERLEQAGSPMTEAFAGGGEALTSQGRRIPYDLLVWCTGGRPNTSYMKANFPSLLNQVGRVRVTPELRVAGMDKVFALGDITDLDENKMAWHIDSQVRSAEHNIRFLLTGRGKGLRAHKPQTGSPKMAVTLGSRNGVIHLPVMGVVRCPAFARMAKSAHMLVPKYRKALGV